MNQLLANPIVQTVVGCGVIWIGSKFLFWGAIQLMKGFVFTLWFLDSFVQDIVGHKPAPQAKSLSSRPQK